VPTGYCEIVQTSGLPSGVLYAVGFTLNAFQDKNNPAITCSFTVTVNDTTPPVITCPPNQIQRTGPAIATYPPPEVSDNCGAAPADCTPPSGSQFPLGTTKVDCSTTDGSSNLAVCAFDVQVDPPPRRAGSRSPRPRRAGRRLGGPRRLVDPAAAQLSGMHPHGARRVRDVPARVSRWL